MTIGCLTYIFIELFKCQVVNIHQIVLVTLITSSYPQTHKQPPKFFFEALLLGVKCGPLKKERCHTFPHKQNSCTGFRYPFSLFLKTKFILLSFIHHKVRSFYIYNSMILYNLNTVTQFFTIHFYSTSITLKFPGDHIQAIPSPIENPLIFLYFSAFISYKCYQMIWYFQSGFFHLA